MGLLPDSMLAEMESDQKKADEDLVAEQELQGPLEPDPPDWGGEHDEVKGEPGISGDSVAADLAADVGISSGPAAADPGAVPAHAGPKTEDELALEAGITASLLETEGQEGVGASSGPAAARSKRGAEEIDPRVVSSGSAAAGQPMDVEAKTRSAKRRKTFNNYLELKRKLQSRPVEASPQRDDPMGEVEGPRPRVVLTARDKVSKKPRVKPMPSQLATQIWPTTINDGVEYGDHALTYDQLHALIHKADGPDTDGGWMKPSVPIGRVPYDHLHGSHHTKLSSRNFHLEILDMTDDRQMHQLGLQCVISDSVN